jgi:predicted amidophosphoribosyltransferase
MTLRSAVLDALSVVSPVRCAGCGRDDRGLCSACVDDLAAVPRERVTPGGLIVTSALRYEATARAVILAFKEQGRTDAAAPLSRALSLAVLTAAGAHASGIVELTAPPAGRGSARRRGFDPVPLLLARARLPAPSVVVRRSRVAGTQKSLDRAGRAANALGALAATSDLTGRSFVLVDDVLTSGATLDALAETITAAGGLVVAGAVLAFTPLRSADHSLGMPGRVRGRG